MSERRETHVEMIATLRRGLALHQALHRTVVEHLGANPGHDWLDVLAAARIFRAYVVYRTDIEPESLAGFEAALDVLLARADELRAARSPP